MKVSLPKGVTVKGNTNEEVEQIDESTLSADHKTAITKHVKKMWGKGTVSFDKQDGKHFVSHTNDLETNVHSIHYKKGVPHVTHFMTMQEEVEQIDELTPSTLRSYRDSANWDVRGIRSGDDSNDDFDRDAMMKRRRKGAVLSAKKLRGTAKVNAEVEVKDVTTGALTVILNDLVDVCCAVAAETVNVDVVFVTTADAVPVIAPVDELIERPVGKEPDVIEYVIVSPSGSVAAADDSV